MKPQYRIADLFWLTLVVAVGFWSHVITTRSLQVKFDEKQKVIDQQLTYILHYAEQNDLKRARIWELEDLIVELKKQ